MANPTAIVPYFDQFDESMDEFLRWGDDQYLNAFDESVEDFLLLSDDQDRNLESPDLPLPEVLPNSSSNHSIPRPVGPTDYNHDSQAGPSGFRGETSNREGIPRTQNYEFGNPVQLSVWPAPPVPYNCSCCQVLREIIHTNGSHWTKLEIHGRLGMISHAILENRSILSKNQYQMFDFCKKSIDAVRDFLVEYCEDRKQSGYTMLQNPLSTFYEALCVGLSSRDDNLGTDHDDFLQPPPGDSDEYQMNQPQTVSEELRRPRPAGAVQRERTAKMTLKDFVAYLHLPMESAAKQMKVCPTVVKRICRKHGLSRWPYRKIRSIQMRISNKRAILETSNDARVRARAQADLGKLEQELDKYINAIACEKE